MRSSLISLTAPMKSIQKSSSTFFQSISLLETRSSCSSSDGGEVVFDVALEEAFQEADDDAALVFGDQPLLVDAHIAAVLQHLQDRGVGRGPADAELFHALDQRRFGKARRRLGEVLRGVDRLAWSALVLRHRRQAARLFVLGGLVDAFLIEREEAVELHDLAGGAQVDVARAVWRRCRRWCARVRRDSIWLATARFQISS